MSIPISQQEQSLHAQIAKANDKIVALETKLRSLDDELASLQSQGERYRLLDEISTSLDKLSRMGDAGLFRESTGYDPEKHLQQVREVAARHQQHIAAIEKLRSVLQADINKDLDSIRALNYQLAELQEIAENLSNEFVLERQPREIRYRATTMPWSIQGEDERRFRRILFVITLIAVIFGGLIPVLRPPVEENMGIVVPERIARIIKKKQEVKPEEPQPEKTDVKKDEKTEEKIAEKKADKVAEKAVEKAAEKAADKVPDKVPDKVAEKAVEKAAEKAPSIGTFKPSAANAQTARSSAETKGVLAFKSNFADLMEESPSLKIGADARILSKANKTASTAPQRSVIVAQAAVESGGINAVELNRQSEGDGGQRIVNEGIKFTRVESVASGADRPLGKGEGPSRTDEEIQIVFDRYKSALYRIYNRELRINPTLRGRVVLRIVIEPDGRVSACTIKTTDLASPALSADIVDRVLKFNFGAKEGVPPVTILYPIDFLPAS